MGPNKGLDEFQFKRKNGVRSGKSGGPVFLPKPPGDGPHHPGYVPIRLMILMNLMAEAFLPPGDEFDNVDLFAGRRAIAKAYRYKSLKATAMDIILDVRDDLLSPVGFLRSLWAVMNLKLGGLLSAGIKCSSWSIVNRGTSKRTKQRPLGCRLYRSVREANLMVSRVTLLCMVALHRGANFMLENPLQSLIYFHPRLRKFLKKRGHTEQMTWLGMYGAKTWKPVKLVSSSKEVQRLYRKLNKKKFGKSGSTRQYRSASGKLCFQGVPGKSRETEVYPPEFGRVVCSTFSRYATPPGGEPLVDGTPDDWNDARLDEVEACLIDMLNNRVAKRKESI